MSLALDINAIFLLLRLRVRYFYCNVVVALGLGKHVLVVDLVLACRLPCALRLGEVRDI